MFESNKSESDLFGLEIATGGSSRTGGYLPGSLRIFALLSAARLVDSSISLSLASAYFLALMSSVVCIFSFDATGASMPVEVTRSSESFDEDEVRILLTICDV